MQLGVMTVCLHNKTVEETFKYLSNLGVQTVEIGCGGYPGDSHLNAIQFINDENKVTELKQLLTKYNLTISALSVHGNPVHPNLGLAKKYHEDFVNGCKVAKLLGVDTINTFSGCPGDQIGAKYPNWVTCSWPEDYNQILEFQWNEVLIPYWKEAVKIANENGVTKIALEMHPGFSVYNPATLLKLRDAVGNTIGANFDPSHLFWQGIRPSEAIKALKGAIYHFHAKDTKIDKVNTGVNGVLDTRHYSDLMGRSWIFRTVGYGHGQSEWKEIMSTLKAIGYEGAISIEHEDAFMSMEEGLEKAIEFLKEVIIFEKSTDIWWA